MRTATLLLFLIGCGSPTPTQVFETSLGRDASAVAVDADGRAWSIARPSGGGAELIGIDGTGAFAATTTLSAFVGAPAPVLADGGIWVMNTAIFEFNGDGGALGEHLPYPAARQIPAWDGTRFWVAGGTSGVPDDGQARIGGMTPTGTMEWEAEFPESWLGMAQPALAKNGTAVVATLDTTQGPLRVAEVDSNGGIGWQTTIDWLNLSEAVAARGPGNRTALGNREQVAVISSSGEELYRVTASDGGVYAGKRLIVPTLTGLSAYSPSGKLLWEASSGGAQCSIPAIDQFGMAYTTCASADPTPVSNFVMVDTSDGEVLRNDALGVPFAPKPAALRDGRLYLVAGTVDAKLIVFDGVGDPKSGWSQAYANAERTGSL